MAGSFVSIRRKKHAKHARKWHWSVSVSLVHRPVRVLGLVGVVVLTPLFVLAPFGNAAQLPTTVRIGQIPGAPPGTTVIGPALSSTALTLHVVLTPQDPTALAGFINELYDPSTEYHQFLAPGQFGPEFGATQSTIQSVSSALTSLGLTPGQATPNDLTIPVSTTVAKAETALNVQIDNYSVPGGRTAYGNTAAPEVPVSVAGDITNILGLSNVAQASSSVGQVTLSSSGSSPAPPPCRPQAARRRVPPPRIRVMRLPTSLRTRTGLIPAPTRTGDWEPERRSRSPNLNRSNHPTSPPMRPVTGSAPTVNTTNVDGGPGTGYGAGEASDDIEDLAGLAPDATIDVYQAPNTSLDDLYDVYNTIATNDTAQVVSSSWGQCEAIGGASFDESEEPIFEQMATQGQTMVVASGDTGSSECYRKNSSGELDVSDASSDPYVTGVGGTQLTSFGPPPSETVWNDQYGAGGGGISEFWQMPSYQQALAISADSSGTPCGAPSGDYCREVPDVSALSGSPYYAFYHEGVWGGWDGTSLSTPLWGALTALADEGCSKPAGFLNPELYTNSGNLNDITSGNNDDASTGYTGGLYPATASYDMADGLGSPTAALFAPGVLCASESAAPTITSVSPNSGPQAGGTTVTITGTGFTGVTKVAFGGVAAKSFTFVSATEITAVSPAQAPASPQDLGDHAQWHQCRSDGRPVHLPARSPPVTAVSPNSGPQAGGTTVTITGTGFTGATKVVFGTVAATSFTVVSATQITAVSPAQATAVAQHLRDHA